MGEDNREGVCTTGKVRYADDVQASIALERVRAQRLERPDDQPPERIFYSCQYCDGWHLSSRPPELDPPPAAKADGETWEEYAHRLERRIKEQRDHIAAINALRADAANRAERKRIDHLRYSLGLMTERWEAERVARLGLVDALKRNGTLVAAVSNTGQSQDSVRADA